MNSARIRVLVMLVAVSALATSCGTRSRVESTWEIPGYVGGPFNNIVVIGVMKNHETSKSFEIGMVEKLQHAGVTAEPGFTVLGANAKLSKKEMETKVAATGADAVLISKVIAVDKTNTYVPPTTYVTSDALYGDWWDDPYWGYYSPYPYSYWGYWYPAMQVVSTPGYWKTESTFMVESALYRASDGRLVWTAESATYNPTSNINLAKSLAPVILKKLEKSGLIAVRS